MSGRKFSAALALAVAVGCGSLAAANQRVVSLGGDVTEIVYQLGAEDQLVAVDTTSTYPEAAGELPDVGYLRALSAEGVLALTPDLILASGDAGPPNVIEQLRAAGVKVVSLEGEPTLGGVAAKIRTVGEALGMAERAEELAVNFEAERAEVAAAAAAGSGAPMAAVYLMGRGDGTLLAAGRGTAADVMLAEAGLRNVITDYDGYKPVSPEALIGLQPEVIVTGTRTVAGVGGLEKLTEHPALTPTPAVAAQRVLVFDDLYLLGMGPRAARAAAELARAVRK